jgi:hypothetical protein
MWRWVTSGRHLCPRRRSADLRLTATNQIYSCGKPCRSTHADAGSATNRSRSKAGRTSIIGDAVTGTIWNRNRQTNQKAHDADSRRRWHHALIEYQGIRKCT